jgi:hypothetical protein
MKATSLKNRRKSPERLQKSRLMMNEKLFVNKNV